MKSQPVINTQPKVSDEVGQTTCYMCACRCGINVHLKDGDIRYIEGNRNHPVNQGVLCAKGSAGIMQHNSPARLRAPLKRVGPRGSGQFEEISWDEALETATQWLGEIRQKDPRKLAFFTGRDQSQALTGWWAQQYGTPNFAAHGGFCSVNMAAAGIYTLGGAFWEFGSPDWELTKLFMMFGVAEDHDSNPIKIGIGRLKDRGVRVISVNPVQTGYSAVADDWVSITPGTDGLLIQSLIYELLRTNQIDLDYLIRYTNAAWLVNDAPGTEKHGLFARNEDGDPQVLCRATGQLISHRSPGIIPNLTDAIVGPDGVRLVSVFSLMIGAWLSEEFAPEATESQTGVPASRVKQLAAELAHVAFEQEIEIPIEWTDWKGEKHQSMKGHPVSMHAMRGISAHSNGFQTCRALHILQLLLGSVDVPGGFRFKPPYPKSVEMHPKPAGHANTIQPGQPLSGAPLGYPRSPDDLLIDDEGRPVRIDKAFSWDAPLSVHGLMHMVISNAHAGDPYPIDVLFMYMANMAWNSSMNSAGVIEMLTDIDTETGDYKIPKLIYSDAYASEMVAYADLVLPDTTYLERHDCISLLDRPISEPDAVADAIRWPVVELKRNVRGFQSVLLDLGARLDLPGMVDESGAPMYRDYADYIMNHQRKPGVGPLAGFRGVGDESGRGEPNAKQLDAYIENGGFWMHELPDAARYYKAQNADYQQFAVEMGFYDAPAPYVYQIYSEELQKFRLAAEGFGSKQPPEHLRERVHQSFTPLPEWYAPFEGEMVSESEFPIYALTQRPMAMYHSWGSQNPWLRQIHGHNPLFVSSEIARQHTITDDDWVWVRSYHGRIKVQAVVMHALNPNTVWTWNAIGKRKGAWQLDPDAPEVNKGFLLNHLIHELLPERGDGLRWANSDPITGQAAWYDLKVSIEKADPDDPGVYPEFPPIEAPGNLVKPASTVTYGMQFQTKKGERS
ncbi:MAG: formate dehydrogenase [Gammaproteobacteria bacterium]|nr:formate dehydrogenase [Gammaproteobacteria bacterium]OUX78035.1 MAG: formate dehydrogenase [Oceanospirillales bacterium TMED59]